MVDLSGFEHLLFWQGIMIVLILECYFNKPASTFHGLWHNDGRSGISAFGGNTGLDVGNIFRYGIQFACLRVEARGNIYSAKSNGSIAYVFITLID